MAISNENGGGMVMPVGPMYGSGFGGGFGGDSWWGILLLIALLNGGFGGFGGWGGAGMMGMGMMDGMGLYPWLNNSEHISDGFRDQQLSSSISALQSSVTSGFGDVQTALCGGFAGVNAGIANAAAQAEISANARQMANMQQMFGVQSALQQCCCDNRAGLADLKYTVASESCSTRTADANNTTAVLNAISGGIQSIKDQLCQDKIDAKNDLISQLRQEVLFARGKDSQDLQTAQITNDVYNRLATCPVGTVPVFGNQPIWTCASNVANSGCGCGCNG